MTRRTGCFRHHTYCSMQHLDSSQRAHVIPSSTLIHIEKNQQSLLAQARVDGSRLGDTPSFSFSSAGTAKLPSSPHVHSSRVSRLDMCARQNKSVGRKRTNKTQDKRCLMARSNSMLCYNPKITNIKHTHSPNRYFLRKTKTKTKNTKTKTHHTPAWRWPPP